MQVLVMGAGAVGGYFGGRLAQAGVPVAMVARGEHLAALRRDGLRVESVAGDFAVRVEAVASPSEAGPADLVLFAVKSYDTEAAARAVAPCLAPGGFVLCLQNGVENEAVIGAACGPDRVLPGVAYIGAERVAPGRIVHGAAGFIELGGEGAEPVAQLFEAAGVRARLVDDARRAKWRKLLYNCGLNAVTTLAEARTGDICADDEAAGMFREAVSEAWRVGRAEGVALADDLVERVMGNLAQVDMGSSMLQDRLRGRPLEVEACNGTIVRLGRRHGLPVPVNRTLYACLRLLARPRPPAPAAPHPGPS